MRVLKAAVENFVSYSTLNFDYEHQGLTLVYGPSGVGKSTLQDIVSWTLFGVTAKGGAADHVRLLGSDEATQAVLEVTKGDGVKITVTRKRGKSSSQNDLFFEIGGIVTRGKNAAETQDLLSKRLGITQAQYLLCAHYNEFSTTSYFFEASASERRRMMVELANVSFATLLVQACQDEKKELKLEYTAESMSLSRVEGRLEELSNRLQSLESLDKNWSMDQEQMVRAQEEKAALEQEKYDKSVAKIKGDKEILQAKMQALCNELSHVPSVCEACQRPNAEYQKKEQLLVKMNHELDLLEQREKISFINVHILQLERLKTEKNPYSKQIYDVRAQLDQILSHIATQRGKVKKLEHRMHSLDQLKELSGAFRAQILSQVVENIQDRTNEYLISFFDSLMTVKFEITNDDNIEITLFKDGHEYAFTQLSRGEQTILRLCFALAVMKQTAHRAGVYFDTLFFDEVLDGLDSGLKAKAFALFEKLALEHNSVFLIDHEPSFQNLFQNKIRVTQVNHNSIICME